MLELNLPEYAIKIKKEGGTTFLFDPVRKKYIRFTPEEWVRQNFIQYLIQEKGYPQSLMAVEKTINLLQTKKRCDIVLYSNQGIPKTIVECKRPSVAISQETFDQIARYNMSLNAEYLIVTNGMNHYICKMDHLNESYQFLREVPDYGE